MLTKNLLWKPMQVYLVLIYIPRNNLLKFNYNPYVIRPLKTISTVDISFCQTEKETCEINTVLSREGKNR